MTYKLNDLVIGYPGKRVAGPINAELRAGELTCLLGPNGAGKSTLLRTLAAFQPALEGEMHLDDTPLQEIPPRKLSTMVGVVLTDRIDVRGITVRDLVGMGRSPYTNFWGKLTREDEEQIAQAIGQVGIESLADRQVTTLSDGERQKVMIAKALAQGTPIIFLDEPTAFLDFPSKVETMLLLKRLCREMQKSVFLSTHDLDLALQTADRLWLLAPGQQVEIGTPQDLAQSDALPRFFKGEHIGFDRENLRFFIR